MLKHVRRPPHTQSHTSTTQTHRTPFDREWSLWTERLPSQVSGNCGSAGVVRRCQETVAKDSAARKPSHNPFPYTRTHASRQTRHGATKQWTSSAKRSSVREPNHRTQPRENTPATPVPPSNQQVPCMQDVAEGMMAAPLICPDTAPPLLDVHRCHQTAPIIRPGAKLAEQGHGASPSSALPRSSPTLERVRRNSPCNASPTTNCVDPMSRTGGSAGP